MSVLILHEFRGRFQIETFFTSKNNNNCKKLSFLWFSGDLGNVYADPSYANKVLKWQAKLSLDDMCVDLWRWQTMNPNGYRASNKE